MPKSFTDDKWEIKCIIINNINTFDRFKNVMKTHRMTFRCRYKYSFPIFDTICPIGQSSFRKIMKSSMDEARENNFKSLENNNN